MSETAHATAVLDHLLWAAPDREGGIRALEEATGVRAAIGGRHPGEGTHNALAGLGPNVYLEVIAPDPELPPGGLSRRIEHLREPSLELWAARTTSAEATAAAAVAAGLSPQAVSMSRQTPDGRTLRWKLVWVTGHRFGPLVPFFIDWLDTEHPAKTAPAGLSLVSFTIRSPQADALSDMLRRLRVQATVEPGGVDELEAELDSPRGRVRLAGPAAVR